MSRVCLVCFGPIAVKHWRRCIVRFVQQADAAAYDRRESYRLFAFRHAAKSSLVRSSVAG